VVLNLLRERIGQPRKAPGLHPHVQVLPFGKGRADMVRVRIAFDYRLARTCTRPGYNASRLRGSSRRASPAWHSQYHRQMLLRRPADMPCGHRWLAGRGWRAERLDSRSSMKMIAESLSRPPTNHDGISGTGMRRPIFMHQRLPTGGVRPNATQNGETDPRTPYRSLRVPEVALISGRYF
jgi:hypothetical protein